MRGVRPVEAHYPFLNPNAVDAEGREMFSVAHRGVNWAKTNNNVGNSCVGLLDLSFVTGLVGDYFNSFYDQENNFVKFFSNAFNAISGALFGKREEDMYSSIYGAGIDKVSDSDLNGGQQKILEKVPFLDDWLENAYFLKDRVINKLWKWTTKISSLEPTVFFMSSFFGRKWSDAIFSSLQTFSRTAWRTTYFFPLAFHGNFVRTIWDLSKLKFLSLFGGKKANDDLKSLVNNLGSMARNYSEKVYSGGNSSLGDKEGISAYLWMLMDRMKQHFRGIRNPEEVLKEKTGKVGDGKYFEEVSEEDRKSDPSKILSNGYADPSSREDQASFANSSVVAFTAPICATVGLIGTLIFEPLRCVWEIAGFEKAKSLFSFAATLRGPASLFNYYFKFFVPEKNAGLGYKTLKDDVENGTVNEAVKLLYKARKGRVLNSYMGMSLLGASLVETFGNLFNSTINENRGFKFIFSSVSRFVNVGFTRYFSARRRDLGLTNLVYQAAKIYHQKRGVNLKIEQITDEHIKKISDNADFINIMNDMSKREEVQGEEPKERFYDPLFKYVAEKTVNIVGALAG